MFYDGGADAHTAPEGINMDDFGEDPGETQKPSKSF
jgi:hypothetical protein